MARKDVFKGTLAAMVGSDASPSRNKAIMQSAALGAVESGLARSLVMSELDPAQIDASEFADRIPSDPAELASLVESIRQNGQQIPILVNREDNGRYRIIYGRRRLAAMRELGLKVRALVTKMDPEKRIIAQGVENTVRQDLSFVEKALFAHRLRQGGVDEATLRQALNIDVDSPKATTISTMKMVVDTLGPDLIMAIGRAPNIGRPRWRALADLYREKTEQVDDEQLGAILASASESNSDEDPSDLRFKALFTMLAELGSVPPAATTQKAAEATTLDPLPAEITRNRNKLVVTVSRKDAPGFYAWMDAQAESLIRDLYDRWTIEQGNSEKEAH